VRYALRLLCACALALALGPALAQTVDEDLSRCPTAAEVASVDAKLTLVFEADPTAPVLACSAANGSADLTLLQKRAYNVTLAMQRIAFDAPLPWTSPQTASLWSWFTEYAKVRGIRFAYSALGGNSFCCNPQDVLNIVVGPDSYLSLTDRWDTYTTGPGGFGGGLGDTLALMVHEARHNEGQLHDCAGGNDTTFEQMGAWAVQSWLWYWIANHGSVHYVRPVSREVGSDYYLDDARNRAEGVRASRICKDSRSLRTVAGREFYDASQGHYFLTADVAEAASIEGGEAGPGWSPTGKSLKVFPDAASAPMNALPVCRFYGGEAGAPKSHFYTVDPGECAQARLDPRWTSEGIAFYLLKPYFDHSCPIYNLAGGNASAGQRVWRSFNAGTPETGASHRYTAEPALYRVMTRLGWKPENVALCAAE
jgi:hypothetical protein